MQTLNHDSKIIVGVSDLESSNKESSLRVLHVDDDPSILEISKQILMDMGNFEIDHACCVDEAFQKLASGHFDVIISDYEMPQRNGLDFLRELKQQKSGIAFVLFTGKGREEVAMSALNLGADGYYNKQGLPETVYGELAHGMRLAVDRRKTEEALRKSEEKYSELINGMNDTAWVIDLDANFVDVNNSAVKVLGYSREELLSMGPEDIDNSLSKEQIRDLVKRMPADQVQVFETTHTAKDGKKIPVEISSSLVTYQGKQAVLSIARNITERKKTESALAQSEEQFKQFFSCMPSAVAIYDAVDDGKDFVLRDFNSAAEKIEKIGKAAVLGRHVTEVFPGVKDFGILEVFERVWKTGQAENFPTAFYHDDRELGSWRENWVIKLPNNNIAAIYNDITERKKAEEALRMSEERTRRILAASPDAILIFDLEGRIIDCNQSAIDLQGYESKEEAVGKNILEHVAKPDHKRAVKGLAQGLVKNLELTFVAKNGREYSAEVSGNVVVDALGKPACFMAITKDITERKKLEEKLRVISGFTRHDIKNKLLVAGGNMYLLRKMLKDKPEAEKYVSEIEKITNNINRILDASKTYEMLGSQKLTLVDVGESVRQAVSLFLSFRGIEVVNEVEDLEVVADQMLSTVFYNLIDNTLKYAQNASQIKIYLKNYKNGPSSLIYEDNGVGIKVEDKPKLFENGFGKSTSYGLFLIKKTCEIYGWTIIENGEPGKGAKFTMTIPKVNQSGKERS